MEQKSDTSAFSWLRNVVKSWVYPVLIWDAVMASIMIAILAWERKTNLETEQHAFLLWSFVVGLFVTLPSCPICRKVNRRAAAAIGLGFGVVTPFAAAWFWARLIEPLFYDWSHPWGLPQGWNWTALDAWVSAMMLAMPSGMAGAIVGFLQAKLEKPEASASIPA